MKKVFSLILCLVLACSLTLTALADGFDASLVKENDSLFEFTVNSDEGIAFVDAAMTVRERSFTHPYESESYYSYVYSNLVIIDYFNSTSYPVWRFWVDYVGTKHIYANAVTFTFDGNSYTFTDVADTDRITDRDNGDGEEILLVVIGTDNVDFVTGLETYLNKLQEIDPDDAYTSITENAEVSMTLHGTEDFTVQLPSTFMLEYFLMRAAFIAGGDVASFLDKTVDPTPLKVTSVD